ncbi:ciliary microtubule inner protein 2C [Castor canadensis]|uniref:Ciliary microtubule inner protein 2C n=1 Tax=Castor canadensis TaxID=51338 RepID=A0AC58KKK7_CASCN
MASRSVGTLLSEFNAAYVPPALMPGYQGHVPGVAFAFGASYGTNTFRYFQDHRNAAMEKNFTCFSRGSSFPTVFSSDRTLAIRGRSHTRDHWLYLPSDTHFNLDSDGSEQLNHFYQAVQQHRKHYRDKTGTVPCVPYFVLPVREQERHPLPTNLPPLSPKKKWHLLRVSPGNVKTYQTFPSGKRVSLQERQKRDCYFEFRA